MKYDINQIASILGVKDNNLYSAEISILLTDSRKLSNPSETLFFALETKNNGIESFYEIEGSKIRKVSKKELKEMLSYRDDADLLERLFKVY